MSADIKLQVLGFVLNKEAPFRAAHLTTALGISRQLTRHHLIRLQEEGLLDQQGIYWNVVDRNKLLAAFTDASLGSNVKQHLVEETDLLDKAMLRGFNNRIKSYLAMRALCIPEYINMKHNLIQTIDESIETLTGARKYLNNGRYTENAARTWLADLSLEDREKLYGIMGNQTGLSPEEFMAWFKENVDKDTEDVD